MGRRFYRREIPRKVRSGFQLRAPRVAVLNFTPAKRRNLLIRAAASTLQVFQFI